MASCQGRGQSRPGTRGAAQVGVAQGQGLAGAHPLVDGVCLAQRALGGRDAVGDAPVALAQTPQLAADLLRAKAPAQARLPPSGGPRRLAGSLPPRGPHAPFLSLKECSSIL